MSNRFLAGSITVTLLIWLSFDRTAHGADAEFNFPESTDQCEEYLLNLSRSKPVAQTEDIALGRAGQNYPAMTWKEIKYLVPSDDFQDGLLKQMKADKTPKVVLTLKNVNTNQMESFEYAPFHNNDPTSGYSVVHGSENDLSLWSRRLKVPMWSDWDYFGRFRKALDYAINEAPVHQGRSLREQYTDIENRYLAKAEKRGTVSDKQRLEIRLQLLQDMYGAFILPNIFRHMLRLILEEVVTRGGKIHLNLDPKMESNFRKIAKQPESKRKQLVDEMIARGLSKNVKEATFGDKNGGLTELETLLVLSNHRVFVNTLFYRDYSTTPISDEEARELYLGEQPLQ